VEKLYKTPENLYIQKELEENPKAGEDIESLRNKYDYTSYSKLCNIFFNYENIKKNIENIKIKTSDSAKVREVPKQSKKIDYPKYIDFSMDVFSSNIYSDYIHYVTANFYTLVGILNYFHISIHEILRKHKNDFYIDEP
jgi:hypothetical protein